MSDLHSVEPGSLARKSHARSETSEFLAFICAKELYAVDLRSVHEIVIPPPITPVPRSPSPVVGVCSVRGQLVTVVDLRAVLRVKESPGSRKERILLARMADGELVGLRVDEVRHVVRLLSSQIEYTSQTLGSEVSDGVRGIGRPTTGEVIVLLDLTAVLHKGCL
jgi:purine-binding chemotaxis protein CheW